MSRGAKYSLGAVLDMSRPGGARAMRFSLYTEIQLHPGKTPETLYAEVLEQIVNADRLGYDAYAVDRALLLPEVLHLREPDGAVRRRRAADAGHPLPHDAACAAVPQPDRAGERDPHHAHPHRRPLRVGRRPRARLDPAEGRRAPRRARATALRGGRRPAPRGARERALLAPRRVLRCRRLARRPVRRHAVPRLPRRHLRPHLHARRGAGLGRRRAAAAPLQGARDTSSTCTGRRARRAGRSRTSSGSTPATSTRTATRRSARDATGSTASSRATARR